MAAGLLRSAMNPQCLANACVGEVLLANSFAYNVFDELERRSLFHRCVPCALHPDADAQFPALAN